MPGQPVHTTFKSKPNASGRAVATAWAPSGAASANGKPSPQLGSVMAGQNASHFVAGQTYPMTSAMPRSPAAGVHPTPQIFGAANGYAGAAPATPSTSAARNGTATARPPKSTGGNAAGG